MLKRVLKWTVIVSGLVVVLGVGAIFWNYFGTVRAKRSFVKVVALADNIVIDFDVEDAPPADGVPVRPFVEIRDRRAINEFVNLVDFAELGGVCGCYGDMHLHFRKGDRTVLTVDQAHNAFLNGVDPGYHELTEESQVALKLWLSKWGGQALLEAQEVAAKQRAESRRTTSRPSSTPVDSGPST